VRVLTAIDLAAIEQLRARDEFFWLDLESPSPQDVKQIGELFDLHPLTIEDTIKFEQRPKLEDFGGFVFVVFYGAMWVDGRTEPIEVHLFISGSYVITIRRDACRELSGLAETVSADPRLSEQFVIYRIFDVLTDTFFPVLSRIDEGIDELADAILEQPDDRQLHQIQELKRGLVEMRRVVTPQRDLFARGIEQIIRLPGLDPETRVQFRDVYDHLIRISEMLDSYRDLLTGTMDVYLSTVSNRLNQVIKQLTILATIFLPLTFVTGFFGQNFGWLVDHIDSFGAFLVFGVGGSLVPIVVLLLAFRVSGYIGGGNTSA
jgi:magnesium transporter